jgi:hypothetical protein
MSKEIQVCGVRASSDIPRSVDRLAPIGFESVTSVRVPKLCGISDLERICFDNGADVTESMPAGGGIEGGP